MRTFTTRQRQRAQRERIAEIIADLFALALKAAMLVLIAYFIAWVGINWLTGCGETFITYTGERIAGECIPFAVWNWR